MVGGKYVAVIGDIVDSKNAEDRKGLQRKLKQILADVNTKYPQDIAARFTISLGDEFQGLLQRKHNILKIACEIERAMHPARLRFGIGIGDVSTDIDFYNSPEIDGSAYHRARSMIETIKNRQRQHAAPYSNIMISSADESRNPDQLMNALLSACTALKSKWTDRQTQIIHAYLSNGENQHKAAESLNITQSTVSRSLNTSNFYTYKSALDTLTTFLEAGGGYS